MGEGGTMKIYLIFAWYDFWIGLYFDRKKKCLYFFPFPMIGFVLEFKGKSTHVEKPNEIDQILSENGLKQHMRGEWFAGYAYDNEEFPRYMTEGRKGQYIWYSVNDEVNFKRLKDGRIAVYKITDIQIQGSDSLPWDDCKKYDLTFVRFINDK